MSTAAYRVPLVSPPGVLFRGVRCLAIGLMLVVGVSCGFHFVGRALYATFPHAFEYDTCERIYAFLDSIHISPSLQRAVITIPPPVTAAMFVLALVAFIFLPSGSIVLDTATRTLMIRRPSRLLPNPVERLPLEELDAVGVHGLARAVFSVWVMDVAGERYELTGHRLGRGRAEAIAQTIRDAAGLYAVRANADDLRRALLEMEREAQRAQ